MKKIYSLVLTLLFLFIGATAFADDNNMFRVTFSGDNNNSSQIAKPEGRLDIKFHDNDNQAFFNLYLLNTKKVTSATIHCSLEGGKGPRVVVLFGRAPGGFDINGKAAGFALRDENILDEAVLCPEPIRTISDMADMARRGELYVEVATNEHGEENLRGQIK